MNRYVIMGNHEDMILRDEMFNIWQYNGGAVTLKEMEDYGMSLDHLKEELSRLPYVIYVVDPTGEKSFRVVHGEFPLVNDDILYNSLKVSHRDSKLAQCAVWNREVVENRYNISKKCAAREFIEEHQPMKTFSGHTPVGDMFWSLDNRHYIDTGMKTLTLIDAHSLRCWLAT